MAHQLAQMFYRGFRPLVPMKEKSLRFVGYLYQFLYIDEIGVVIVHEFCIAAPTGADSG